MKVQSKTIVVTGGGSGIGWELVLAFLKKWGRVAALARTSHKCFLKNHVTY